MTTTPPMTPLARSEADFISAARLLMICGLVFHHLFEIPGSEHSPRLSVQNVEHFAPEFINAFFHMAFMTAVPLLSVISGFLFFNRPTLNYPTLLSRRFYSVALPTWLWSALWLCLGYVLFMTVADGERFRWTAYGFENMSAMTVINGIFGVTREPFAFQFWFVRDLLLVLLLTPFIHVALSYLGWRLLPLIGIAWLLIPDPPLFFSGNVPVFFTIGAYLAMPQSPPPGGLLQRLRDYRWLLLALFGMALVCRIMSHVFGPVDAFLQGHIFLCALRLLGSLAVAALIYHMVTSAPSLTQTVTRYSGCSFFIFAVHFPLIELLQEVVVRIPGHDTALGLFCSWLFVPVLTIAIALGLALWCERYLPALFSLMNGGRESAGPRHGVRIEKGASARSSGLNPRTP